MLIRPRILLFSNDPPIASQVIENLDPRFFNVYYVPEIDFGLFKRIFFEFRPHMVIDRIKASLFSAGDGINNELISDFLWRYEDSEEIFRHIPTLSITNVLPETLVCIMMGNNEHVSEGVGCPKKQMPWVTPEIR